jgi:hypothetical protein
MHAMKAIAIIVVLLLVVVNALELLPAASAFQMYLSGGAVALSLVALIAILVGRGPSRDDAEAARPMPVTTRANQADAEIVSFLAMIAAAPKRPAWMDEEDKRMSALLWRYIKMPALTVAMLIGPR